MSSVEDHYAAASATDGIVTRIIAAVRALEGEGQVTPATLAPFDHFHGRGLQATRDMVALLEPQADETILDIGSGIGGPARWIAATFGCKVTGVDLTAAFCEAARQFTALTGQTDRVTIVEASALDLPFPAEKFDRAYSQNVLMNIEDKARVYREAFRMLKPGGRVVLSNLAAGPNGPPYFPVPWASLPQNSFLATDAETRRDLEAAGFRIVRFDDTTAESLVANVAARRRVEMDGLPPTGPHVLMGEERFREMVINGARSVEDGRVRSVEIMAKKPL